MKRTILALLVLMALVVVIAQRFRWVGDTPGERPVVAEGTAPAVEGANPAAILPAAGTEKNGPSHGSRSAPQSKRDAAYFLTKREEFFGIFEEPALEPLRLPPPMESKVAGMLDARSPEDAVWLDQHGYPSETELSRLEHTSEQELAEKAANGDIASMALLGEKLLREGEIVGGYNNLHEAALLGSVWAVLRLGDAQKRGRNYHDAFALFNLAAWLGDWDSPGYYLQSGMGPATHSSFFAYDLRKTAVLMANLQHARQQRGLPPIVPAQRPQIYNLLRGAEPVGIYPRRR